MVDFNKYIGIPFREHGRDERGLDCFGLVKLILKNEFGKELPDWKYDEPGNTSFNHTEDPKVGTVGMFNLHGMPAHVGLYIGDGKILHVLPGETSVAEKLKSRRLQGNLEGWYNAE